MGGEKLSCISLLGELLESPPQCGEKMGRFSCTNSVPGSPPRRRGKTDKDDVSGLDLGITPAGRGKELVPTRGFGFKRITPAWAGKSRLRKMYRPAFTGSPPRRRGKVGLDGGLSEAVGITPAQAGKSKLALCTPSCPTDHPCAGGEKNKELEGVWLPMGSPPRGRGKVYPFRVGPVAVRITPAWAGKSTTPVY